jgi:hypothetical protein
MDTFYSYPDRVDLDWQGLAELQRWNLSLETGQSGCEPVGRRQVSRMLPRLNAKSFVEVISGLNS